MKRAIAIFFVIFVSSLPATGTSGIARSIPELKVAFSNHNIGTKFDFNATVTFHYPAQRGSLVLQDRNEAISIYKHASIPAMAIRPGDRVHVTGTIDPSEHYKGQVAAVCNAIRVLAHEGLPKPLPVRAEEFSVARYTHLLVSVEGILSDVFSDQVDKNWTYFAINCDDRTVYAVQPLLPDGHEFDNLIGKRVRVCGTPEGNPGARQILGSTLNLASIEPLQPSDATQRTDPFDVPDIEGFAFFEKSNHDRGTRRCATGQVIAVWDRDKLLLKTKSGAIIRGELAEPRSPHFGDHIKLSGFPETDLFNAILIRAVWKSTTGPQITDGLPDRISANQIQSPDLQRYDFNQHGKLVKLTGIVRGLPIRGGDGRLYLDNDDRMVATDVSAILESFPAIEIGSLIEVCGTCVIEAEKMTLNQSFPRITGFRIVPRVSTDIKVISGPPWWTPSKLLAIIAALLILATIIAVRARIVRNQSKIKLGERTRLAVELHDTIAQNLTGASFEINAAERLIPTDSDASLKHLARAARTLKSCRDELRNCIWDLRNLTLEAPDMNTAIRSTLEPHIGNTALSIRFNVPRTLFTDNSAHALIRIIRELTLNAIRHGDAKNVKIAGSVESGVLHFSVRDDGSGFDPDNRPGLREGHFGLQGIQERLKKFNGEMTIQSHFGAGTRIAITLVLSPRGRRDI